MLTPEEMKDKMHEISRKGDYIDSIFNYCDRWCKRCDFTEKCRNYAFNEDAPPPDGEQIWEYLQNVFKATKLMLEESVENTGLTLEEADKMAPAKEPDLSENQLYQKSHQLAIEVEEWLKTIIPHQTITESPDQHNPGPVVNEVMEVIQWYNLFIPAKICRALSGIEEYPVEEIQTDSNGSAKICLIALDRIIAAWSVLMDEFPEHQDKILSILINLAEIRKQAEEVFPNARKFLRPGFDK